MRSRSRCRGSPQPTPPRRIGELPGKLMPEIPSRSLDAPYPPLWCSWAPRSGRARLATRCHGQRTGIKKLPWWNLKTLFIHLAGIGRADTAADVDSQSISIRHGHSSPGLPRHLGLVSPDSITHFRTGRQCIPSLAAVASRHYDVGSLAIGSG